MARKARPTEAPSTSVDTLRTGEFVVERVASAYNADSIEHLDDVEHVRRHPDMYIGGRGPQGLHHLIREIVNNSADEFLAGYATEIRVTLRADNSISVVDNGRGIPVDVNAKAGISGLELAMTKLKAGGKFGKGGYVVSGGLHGVGLSCVNFLSEWCEAIVNRDGRQYRLRCERGIPTGPIRKAPSPPAPLPDSLVPRSGEGSTGTTIHWLADRSIFGEYRYDVDEIMTSLRHICYLAREVTIGFVDERGQTPASTIRYPRGIEQFVEDLNQTKQPTVGDVIYVAKSVTDEAGNSAQIEMALQYTSAVTETALSFANHIHTKEGGTHVSGFRSALSRTINQYARKIGALKEGDDGFVGDDVREGLTAVLSVRLSNPQFEAQTKIKLNNPFMEKMTAAVTAEGLTRYFEEHPQAAKAIVDRVLAARKARLAMEKASTLTRRQSGLDTGSLPGKLADCTERDASKCELFLVEGDSAGGSAKGGRDRRFQAILPLRGKILNVDKTAIGRTLENNEVRSLITAIGTGIDAAELGEAGGRFDLGKLRYHRVIIMTDADVDGSHIRTLLLTFFFRYMRALIEHGHVYMALPPLYAVRSGKDMKRYVASPRELEEVLAEFKKRPYQIARFKGLGELNPDELYETTMNPSTRRLARVTMLDAIEADRIFSILMSDRVERASSSSSGMRRRRRTSTGTVETPGSRYCLWYNDISSNPR